MTEIQLPMPGAGFNGSIVIASAWQNDEAGYQPLWYTLLLLSDTPGKFYSVVDVTVTDSSFEVTPLGVYDNIIPAAEAYSESIGGY